MWGKIILLLPELIKLAEQILRSREMQAEEKPVSVEEAKQHVRTLRKAFKEKDSEQISRAFNSL